MGFKNRKKIAPVCMCETVCNHVWLLACAYPPLWKLPHHIRLERAHLVSHVRARNNSISFRVSHIHNFKTLPHEMFSVTKGKQGWCWMIWHVSLYLGYLRMVASVCDNRRRFSFACSVWELSHSHVCTDLVCLLFSFCCWFVWSDCWVTPGPISLSVKTLLDMSSKIDGR